MRIGVPKESAPHERRVALVPEGVARLIKLGAQVLVQAGAGEASNFPDSAYAQAGATVTTSVTDVFGCEVVAKVRSPSPDEAALFAEGTCVIALAGTTAPTAAWMAPFQLHHATMLALERVPRITRAQSMDVLSSQSTLAGYKAVLLGAAELDRILPMLTTAAGTLAPAKAFIIGAGVAGLQAIATARRLGAVVSAFDVRPAAAEQVRSLGASFLASEVVSAAAEDRGGYAKAQTEEDQRRTLELIGKHVVQQDLVVTTALIPGKPAPRLITAEMVRVMRPGSVIVDLAGESGGNCELTRAGETVDAGGVKIIGPVNLPATVPLHASQTFGKNVLTLLQHLIKDGKLQVDPKDEITGPMLLVHQGELIRR